MFARTVLFLGAAMFGFLGVYLLKEPQKLDEWIGLRATTGEALTELRAFYGGLEIAIGALLAVCALRSTWNTAGCAVLVFVCLGLAAGRLVGFSVDSSASSKMLWFLATEMVFAALGVIAWITAPSTP